MCITCAYVHNTLHTTCKMITALVPTIARAATGARALTANARAEALMANSAIVSMKKKNFSTSGSKPFKKTNNVILGGQLLQNKRHRVK